MKEPVSAQEKCNEFGLSYLTENLTLIYIYIYIAMNSDLMQYTFI